MALNATELNAGIASETLTRVLVVDESKMQRKLVIALLKKWGFEIFEADSGKSALEICSRQSIDLVISDWVMPEMSGLDFCEKFRALPRERYGYFILLTSKSEKDDIAKGLDVGADDFLSKPVNSTELRSRIQAGRRVLDMEKQVHAQNAKTTAALAELQRVYEELNKDLLEAEKLQRSLIPESYSQHANVEISNIFKSSGHVGGDLVGHFNIDQDRMGIYSLDVSGHGVSSALLTIRLAGYLSPFNKEQNIAFYKSNSDEFLVKDPAEIARHLNELMLRDMSTELYFTLAYADVNLRTGECAMVQAGHPHPLIFNAHHGITLLGTGGPPIGMIDGMIYETFQHHLVPNDKLLLHSDGLTECEDPDGALLDEDGLSKILMRNAQSNGPELLNDILWDLADHAQGENFGDDVSAIMLEFARDKK
ncbi:fused response regulator/phosphatase [Amylibacter ulvae]|uniref:Fused response regulator/phosphatase n=1 Tax=Paramylibacter ulvae TaxID=1651968 RepID=A0ABQ3CXX2_9RHOB|nr:SpoIIE family protein phosphatase [Amylibacter ulvae]GHA49181.1 fused response regulator/phosphatase [Amylibacter ulvae]